MAGSKTGTPSIIKLARKICKIVTIWGASDLGAKTNPEFVLAVDALMVACHLFEIADDYPGQIDSSTPLGPEDA